MTNEDINTQVAALLPPAAELAEYTPEQFVHLMETARERVVAGEPLGTVKINGDEVAHRVQVDGRATWRISHSDGTLSYNDQPTLDWAVLHEVTA